MKPAPLREWSALTDRCRFRPHRGLDNTLTGDTRHRQCCAACTALILALTGGQHQPGPCTKAGVCRGCRAPTIRYVLVIGTEVGLQRTDGQVLGKQRPGTTHEAKGAGPECPVRPGNLLPAILFPVHPRGHRLAPCALIRVKDMFLFVWQVKQASKTTARPFQDRRRRSGCINRP